MTDPTAREPIEAMVDAAIEAAGLGRTRAAAELTRAKLLAAISALRRDAERYRWLRDKATDDEAWSIVTDDAEYMNAAIDAAISREAPHG